MEITRTTEPPRQILAIRETVPMNAMTDFFTRAFTEAGGALEYTGSHPSGPPIAVYFGTPSATADVAAGFPFTGEITAPPETSILVIPGGDAVEAIHVGSYDGLSTTYQGVADYLHSAGLRAAEMMWEEYLSGPDADPDPATWRTRVVFPVA